ncbi:MAG TPA: hypothetical protein VMV46_20335 [Thermoanaerobaculia bacterium]|nr:hypothetical protein [Thermoanaerobaculia bacterium]
MPMPPAFRVAPVLVLAWLVAASLGAQNPPAEGFDAAGSDPEAVAIADEVMTAMGGRAAWDSTRYLSWNFFGMRTHVWDRWTGDVRYQVGDTLVLANIHSQEGRAFRDGEEVTDPEERAKLLDQTYKAWVNDSYWLLMPYKLKDSGVTLRYQGEGAMADGRVADVLELTFEGVGVTPDNKYDVYVSKDRRLVEQWSFYTRYDDAEPRFTTPWAGWTRHGGVLLSGDRGERQLSDIRVFEELPRSVFESPEPVDIASFPTAGGGDRGR